jgi:hypothetical protein
MLAGRRVLPPMALIKTWAARRRSSSSAAISPAEIQIGQISIMVSSSLFVVIGFSLLQDKKRVRLIIKKMFKSRIWTASVNLSFSRFVQSVKIP